MVTIPPAKNVTARRIVLATGTHRSTPRTADSVIVGIKVHDDGSRKDAYAPCTTTTVVTRRNNRAVKDGRISGFWYLLKDGPQCNTQSTDKRNGSEVPQENRPSAHHLSSTALSFFCTQIMGFFPVSSQDKSF